MNSVPKCSMRTHIITSTYISKLNTRVNGIFVTEHDDTDCETFRVYLFVRPTDQLWVYVFSIAFNAIYNDTRTYLFSLVL